MTNKQKQIEIAKKLESAPDVILQEVLDHLSDFERKSAEEQKRYVRFLENRSEGRSLLLHFAH